MIVYQALIRLFHYLDQVPSNTQQIKKWINFGESHPPSTVNRQEIN